MLKYKKFRIDLIFLFLLVGGCASGVPLDQAEQERGGIKLKTTGNFPEGHRRESALFFIQNIDNKTNPYGVATTVYADSKFCYLISSNHMFSKGIGAINVKPWSYLGNTNATIISAESINSYPKLDLQLIRIAKQKGIECSPVRFSSKRISPGKSILGYGNPVNGSGVVSKGIVSGVWNIPRHGISLISDMATAPGYSGGAVFSEKEDHFVGMIIGKTNDKNSPYNYAYIVPSNRMIAVLETKIEHNIRVKPISSKFNSSNINISQTTRIHQ